MMCFGFYPAKIRLSERKTKEIILFFAERKYFREIYLANLRIFSE